MTRTACVLITVSMFVAACATDDGDGGGNGGGGGDGECGGSVLDCAWAELSDRQEAEACDLITASIDEPAGTKYECTSGENAGLYLTVEDADTCVSHSYPAGCPVTVQQTLDCFRAARTDACTAFEDTGACGRLLDAAASCQ